MNPPSLPAPSPASLHHKTAAQHGAQFALGVIVSVSLSLLALLASSLLRFEFHIPVHQYPQLQFAAVYLSCLSVLALWIAGELRSQFLFFGLPDMLRIGAAIAATTALNLLVWHATAGAWAPPRSIAILHGILFAGLLFCFRLACRLAWERYLGRRPSTRASRPVAIVGAGRAGARLAAELLRSPTLQLRPVLFVDDDIRKHRTTIHGIPVWGSPEALAEHAARLRLAEALVAMPSAPAARVRSIVSLLAAKGLPCRTLPSFQSFVLHGAVETSLRPVQIEDLLGREPVQLGTREIGNLIRGRVVAVTGAGGSIGSELCRQILTFDPERLVMIEQCEVQLFAVEQQLLAAGHPATRLVPLVADVVDTTSMERILARHQPAILFHAAAHKHVPLMEYQPWEAFLNNTIGTMRLADLAVKAKLERFILISTDKAINPTNVMGATKRLAELYLQALQHSGCETKFMAVRFGNVLGSSGSVIPTFKRQIAAGGPVTVTHPDMTRYFMTVNEAVGLVLQSATQGTGGEIFVLDMGQPMKIVDLAHQLIQLSGLTPGTDIEVKFTGLRPGEKLYEELNHNTENMTTTSHGKIMRFLSTPRVLAPLRAEFARLESELPHLGADEVKLAIKTLVPEYRPQLRSE